MSWALYNSIEGKNLDVEILHGHTHNLSPMWKEAGVFITPYDLHDMRASELADLAARGLMRAVRYPEKFESLNPENGWGDYELFIRDLTKVAIECSRHPEGVLNVY